MPFKTPSLYSYSFLKVHLHHFSMIKSHKNVTKQYKSRLFFILLLVGGRVWIRSRIRSRTNNYGSGSRSRKPKNIRIPQIRIRILNIVPEESSSKISRACKYCTNDKAEIKNSHLENLSCRWQPRWWHGIWRDGDQSQVNKAFFNRSPFAPCSIFELWLKVASWSSTFSDRTRVGIHTHVLLIRSKAI